MYAYQVVVRVSVNVGWECRDGFNYPGEAFHRLVEPVGGVVLNPPVVEAYVLVQLAVEYYPLEPEARFVAVLNQVDYP
jgi:hypothetical protein